ncbi:hypothetical protein BV898_05667 [Hypsibius exemplaris]|uniref:Uncharacterized protein n=1 Tax=Hypsibius exemplaris TaxID=2072580 RepID=A0A1W0WYV0_HYPEX|nr:hypothetical protein BV898_05667 [Hypsibius exemplaris]
MLRAAFPVTRNRAPFSPEDELLQNSSGGCPPIFPSVTTVLARSNSASAKSQFFGRGPKSKRCPRFQFADEAPRTSPGLSLEIEAAGLQSADPTVDFSPIKC